MGTTTEKNNNWIIKNAANIITTIRLILSIWLFILVASGNSDLLLMFIIVIACGVSDALDGWTARRFNIESEIGGFLDRLADKIFICPTFIILTLKYLPQLDISNFLYSVTISLVITIIFLEFLLISGGVIGFLRKINTSSNQWGKRKMVVQSIALFFFFLTLIIEFQKKIKITPLAIYWVDSLLVISIILTIKSIEGYYKRFQQS